MTTDDQEKGEENLQKTRILKKKKEEAEIRYSPWFAGGRDVGGGDRRLWLRALAFFNC